MIKHTYKYYIKMENTTILNDSIEIIEREFETLLKKMNNDFYIVQDFLLPFNFYTEFHSPNKLGYYLIIDHRMEVKNEIYLNTFNT